MKNIIRERKLKELREDVDVLRDQMAHSIERNVILIILLYQATLHETSLEIEDFIGSCNMNVDPKIARLHDIEERISNERKNYTYKEVKQLLAISREFREFISSYLGNFVHQLIDIGFSKYYWGHYTKTPEVQDFVFAELGNIIRSIITDTMKDQQLLFARIDGFIDKVSLVLNMHYLEGITDKSRNNKSRETLSVG